jgi:uncharacterized damage-inducible protein DinB
MNTLFPTMARANRWANQLLFAELAKLTRAQWTQESAVNFGSAQGIANHLVLADQAWLRRFSQEGPAPDTVDAVPWPEIAALLAQREALDERIVVFAETLTPERLDGTLRYRSMSGQPCAESFGLCVAHFFNHQTFHRGQLHALLGVCGVKAPNLDLIYYMAAHRTTHRAA